jgi:hypothetical protein
MTSQVIEVVKLTAQLIRELPNRLAVWLDKLAEQQRQK